MRAVPHKRGAAARPTGTITFLFSDIEGSTSRWETHRDAMKDALRRHDLILTSSIESHHGYVFKTIGDAYCAAFQDLFEAVEAAVDAQRRLAAEGWRPLDALRVRMAIHSGGADERAGDYFGPTVNRVARLLSIGQGGQVLMTATAALILASDLPPEHSVRYLGSYALKGLKEPERVYQLSAPGLITEFQPLRTAKAFANNLPRQSSSFIGRGDDLKAIGELLRSAPLVTIAGPGGVGKTRVALQLASDVAADFSDGAWFIDLAPIIDATLVASAVLSAMDVATGGERSATDTLLEHLKSRRLLLLFDNCEHVIGEVASLASAIVAHCAQMTILSTSREPLNIPSERVYRLPVLNISDAVDLFAQRARAINSNFQVTESNAGVIQDICRRLDGIALGVELAAARSRTLSLDALSRALEQRLFVLAGTSRAVPERQQTMRALIDWSYELLSEDEKAFLRGTAIFKGGFSLEAASAVCGDGVGGDSWRALDLLTSLTDKSLLVADVNETSQRYRLLQSIQEYALERIGALREAQPLSKRHATFYASLAQTAYQGWADGQDADWLARAVPELDNFRACLMWALRGAHDVSLGSKVAADIVPIFLRLSLLEEAVTWCEDALNAQSEDLRVEAELLYGLSMLQNNRGALRSALDAAQRAADLYRKLDDRAGLVRALSQLAQQCARQSLTSQALEAAEEALTGARELGDRKLLATTLRRCAFALAPGQIDRAREQFDESVAIFRASGEDAEVARTLSWWAESESAAGCFERAMQLLEEGLPLADADSRMYMVNNIAGHAISAGMREYAIRYASEALTLASEQQHSLLMATAIAHLATLALENDATAAARLYGYAQARFEQLAWDWARSNAEEHRLFMESIGARFEENKVAALFAEGARWSWDQALEETKNV